MPNKYNHLQAKKLTDIFQHIASSSPVFTDMIEIKPDSHLYTGAFKDQLSLLMDKSLTIPNMKKELAVTKKQQNHINSLIDRIIDSSHALNTVSELYTTMKYTENLLCEYNNSAKFFSWLFNDKTYKKAKETHKIVQQILKDTYNIENKEQLKGFLKKFQKRKKLLKSLENTYCKVTRKKQLLIIAIKDLSKKIKGSIVSKHPELAAFVEMLPCETAEKLVLLENKHHFVPKSVNDIDKEIRACKNQLKTIDKHQKPILLEKIKLLQDIYVKIQGVSSLKRLQNSINRRIQGPPKHLEK